MKNFLILYFIIFTRAFAVMQNEKYYLELPLNSKCEAMGLRGMIFGKEYGSFFLAPTSILERKCREYKIIDIRANFETVTSFRDDYALNEYIRLSNFSVGLFLLIKTPQ